MVLNKDRTWTTGSYKFSKVAFVVTYQSVADYRIIHHNLDGLGATPPRPKRKSVEYNSVCAFPYQKN